jgi:DNA polymerase III epsilon subunit-like protein
VKPGGHEALGDARATVEVFIEQVVRNNSGQVTLDLATPVEHPLATSNEGLPSRFRR